MLKLDWLRLFLVVAKHQHIGQAAAALHLTPSATSHSIATLEAQLGTQFFDRIGRNIHINAQGKQLAVWAAPIVRRLDELERHFSQPSTEPRGMITIAAAHGLASYWVAPIVASIMERFPRVSFDVLATSSPDALARLQANEVDFAVTYDNQRSGKDVVEIAETSIVPVVKRNHPLMKLPPKERWSTVGSYPVAIPRNLRDRGITDVAIAEMVDTSLSRQFVFDGYEAAIKFLLEGNGWSFFPRWVVATRLGRLAILVEHVIKTSFKVRLRMSERSNPQISDALAEALCQFGRTDPSC